MAELAGTLALLALIGVAVWLFGSFALRAGGLLLFFLGLFGLITGTPEALVMVVLGIGAWLGGHWLYAVKHGVHKSALAGKLLDWSVPHRRAPFDEDDAWDTSDGGDEPDSPCFETGKVKHADEVTALETVRRNQDRYDRGLKEYRLERAYLCEFCDWWHVTSQTKRGG